MSRHHRDVVVAGWDTIPVPIREKEAEAMADGANLRARPSNRRAVGVACALHKGPRGFVNLVLEKQGDEIIFDPHVTGECVLILDEDAAVIVRDALIEWLG
ncbi:MAG: hypothetical protein ACRDRS_21465 [Pseudonocardiaceae bacterium]